MTRGVRKLALTAHVTSSVGWFGAVAAFLLLAVLGLSSRDDEMVRAAYIATEPIGWYVIVPFSIASLLTGLVESAITPWGLFQHRWVVTKLVVAVLATVFLLVHMQPIQHIACAAAVSTLASGHLTGLRIQLVADAAAALVVLLAMIGLSLFKPWGRTSYGLRIAQNERGESPQDEATPTELGSTITTPRSRRWGVFALVLLGAAVVLVFVFHLLGVRLPTH